MPTFCISGGKRWQGANATNASQTKRKKGITRKLQHMEAQVEIVGPYCFDGTDDGTRHQNDDVGSFGYDSPHESLADMTQDNTHPDSYDSSSESTFIPRVEDEEEDDDFFGVNLFDMEEEATGLEGLGPDKGMPEFSSRNCHHQGQRAQT
jgi:hypothetical protein